MGAGSSIPDKRAKYVEYDGNNKLVERSVQLSHADRYKMLSRRDENGKVILGIHTNLFHQTRSRTGRALGINGNPHGPGKDKFGRKLSPLELLRKQERERVRKMRIEESRPIVKHGNNIRAILSGLDSKGALDGALMGGNSLKSKQSRRRSKTLGLERTQGEAKEDFPPGVQQRSAVQAAAAAAIAAEKDTSPLERLSPSRRLKMTASDPEDASSNRNSTSSTGNDSPSPSKKRLPIPSSRRRASTSALVNLQRRFGLEESYDTSSTESSSSNNNVSTSNSSALAQAADVDEATARAIAAANNNYYSYNYSDSGNAVQAEMYSSPSGRISPNNFYNNAASAEAPTSPVPYVAGQRRARRHSIAAPGNAQRQDHLHHQQRQQNGRRHQPPPMPAQRTRVSQLPHGWIQYWCPVEESYYYYHPGTDHSVWDKPAIVSQSELPGEAQFRRKRFRLLCEIGAWGSSREVPMEVKLHRNHMIYESIAAVMQLTPAQLRTRFKIVYEGESGIDSGGLTKDWYLELSRKIMSTESQLGLFKKSPDSGLFSIDPRSHVAVEDYKKMFRFVGRLLGKAIYDRHVLDVPLCNFMFKRMLRKTPTLEDIQELDKVYYKSLQWMLNNDITDVIDETFSVLRDEFGSLVKVDLCPDGQNVPVTEKNKVAYVHAVVDYLTGGSIESQLDAFLKGFGEILPRHAISTFSSKELKALVNGKDSIDASELRSGVKYTGGLKDSTPIVQRFWTAFQVS